MKPKCAKCKNNVLTEVAHEWIEPRCKCRKPEFLKASSHQCDCFVNRIPQRRYDHAISVAIAISNLTDAWKECEEDNATYTADVFAAICSVFEDLPSNTNLEEIKEKLKGVMNNDN